MGPFGVASTFSVAGGDALDEAVSPLEARADAGASRIAAAPCTSGRGEQIIGASHDLTGLVVRRYFENKKTALSPRDARALDAMALDR